MSIEGLVVRVHHEDDHCTVSVLGDVLISNAKGLERHLDEVLDSGAQTIVLDITGVRYMDSFGIGAVVQAQSKVDQKHGKFRVLVNESLARLFTKSHLDQYIEIALKE